MKKRKNLSIRNIVKGILLIGTSIILFMFAYLWIKNVNKSMETPSEKTVETIKNNDRYEVYNNFIGNPKVWIYIKLFFYIFVVILASWILLIDWVLFDPSLWHLIESLVGIIFVSFTIWLILFVFTYNQFADPHRKCSYDITNNDPGFKACWIVKAEVKPLKLKIRDSFKDVDLAKKIEKNLNNFEIFLRVDGNAILVEIAEESDFSYNKDIYDQNIEQTKIPLKDTIIFELNDEFVWWKRSSILPKRRKEIISDHLNILNYELIEEDNNNKIRILLKDKFIIKDVMEQEQD